MRLKQCLLVCGLTTLLMAGFSDAQRPHAAPPPHNTRAKSQAPLPPSARPKLVVLLVVDQMRGDYVDKFKGQWTGGLKRLVQEGAWFRDGRRFRMAHAASSVFRRAAFSKWRRHSRGHVLVESASGCHDGRPQGGRGHLVRQRLVDRL